MVDPTDTEMSRSLQLGLGVMVGLVIIVFIIIFFIMREKFWEPIFG